MGLFSSGRKNDRYGIIIDVGSGSVLTAIVHSNSHTIHPTVVWAHREHAALKKVESVQQSAKSVMTAFLNASMKLDSEGRKALKEYDSSSKLSLLQITISAPWSYTVTKSVTVTQDEPIEISENLIDELIQSAQKQVEEDLQEHEATSELDLKVIARATMDFLSNGYRVKEIEGEQAKKLQLTQATVVSQNYLMSEIENVKQKLFPSATVNTTSFILLYYCTMRNLFPNNDDLCLIDITDEATEIGIVRDGSLTYSTHTPYGYFSVAREISEVTNIPLHEALGHLKSESIDALKAKISESKSEEVDIIFKSYIENVTNLFHETGDTLSIPKTLIVHADMNFEPIFIPTIQRAAKIATKIEHTAVSLAEKLSESYSTEENAKRAVMPNDTSLYLAAEFFHKQKHCLDFKYL